MNLPLSTRSAVAFCTLSLAAILLAGCGGTTADSRAIVTGTATYQNKQLTSGTVKIFNSKAEQISSAILQADGTFTATDIPLGDIKVTVETAGNSIGIAGGKAPPGTPTLPSGSSGPSVAIPEKFKAVATSGLNFKITSSSQRIEIKLD